MTTPITFVTPRYGTEVLGGAEAGARQLATRLAADGRDVAVITTRALSMRTWADHYPAGTTTEDGVSVTRCSVDGPRAGDFGAQSDALLPRAAEATSAECERWIDAQGPTSSELVEAVSAVADGVLVFYPYLYHPTVAGHRAAQVPTILYPAAHAEAPLDLPVFDEVFGETDGIAYHTRAEQELVHRRFPSTVSSVQAMVGLPVEMGQTPDPEGARAALGLGDEPFALCLGRVDPGKGVHDLVERFDRHVGLGGAGRLIVAGAVDGAAPSGRGVTCIGPIPEKHKSGLLAAADVLINPSFYESFSIVILEAWLAGTPVLVNGWCGPMVEHVTQSGGGLFYTGVADFDLALERLLGDAELRTRMADAGGEYVRRRYAWPSVRTRFDGLIDAVS
ncbi:MAG: glycosyltransferase family 4 protein [Acidimicrobiales bacterium]|jgi:glycosyltransferase involved in cell wall biosynthesis|nr:glycosyltransferase family 4 protein [Acidimicrobiales bacterium]